jgi:hypothetical protein
MSQSKSSIKLSKEAAQSAKKTINKIEEDREIIMQNAKEKFEKLKNRLANMTPEQRQFVMTIIKKSLDEYDPKTRDIFLQYIDPTYKPESIKKAKSPKKKSAKKAKSHKKKSAKKAKSPKKKSAKRK